jgi:transcriptional regulator with XRE-family HTH domain
MANKNVNPLRKARQKLGISMESLARRAQVSLQSVANWEAYRNIPALKTYPDLACALEITIPELQDIVRQIETEILKRQRSVA